MVNFDRRNTHQVATRKCERLLNVLDVDLVLHLEFIVMSMLLPGAGRAVGTRCAPICTCTLEGHRPR